MKRALVLSGGGSKGAWQAGVIEVLLNAGTHYDIVCGVSVGALNGGYISQFSHGDESDAVRGLKALWYGLKGDKSIYRSWFRLPYIGMLIGAIIGKRSLYNSSPLRKLVSKHLKRGPLSNSGRVFSVGAVQIGSWEYRSWDQSSESIVEAVMASSAFPVFMDPVLIDGVLWTDGGVREITPLAKAISLGATDIDVVVCSPDSVVTEPPKRKWRLRHIVLGLLETFLSEIDRGDLRIANLYNKLAKSDPGVERRVVNIRVIRPSHELVDSLDFNRNGIRANYDRGVRDANDESNWKRLV